MIAIQHKLFFNEKVRPSLTPSGYHGYKISIHALIDQNKLITHKKVALIYTHKKCFLGGHGGLVLKQKKCICYLSLHPQSVAE